ncbi:MAG: hypothetical protein IJD51_04500 [Clostridia bacterium]|nr:hypothetical protein [Clostridia bacterium]
MKEFTVKDISGEYATLSDKDGEELFIALALLPPSVDVGDTLVYENNEFK